LIFLSFLVTRILNGSFIHYFVILYLNIKFRVYTNNINMIIKTLFIVLGLGFLISNKNECTLDDFRCRENIPSMLRIHPKNEEN